MRITRVLVASGWGCYFYEDVATLHRAPTSLAGRYQTPSPLSGMRYLREPAETLSVGFELEDGRVAWGECVGVSYGGKSGRDPVFRSQRGKEIILQSIAPRTEKISRLGWRESSVLTDGLPRAIQYGVSQAMLGAVALSSGRPMWQVVCDEWGLPPPCGPVPIHAQCGGDRYDGADRIISRRPDSLPHSLVDDIPSQFGARGEKLLEYAGWLARRVSTFWGEDYRPILHFDVHGAPALMLGGIEEILDWIAALADKTAPFSLRLESVVIAETLPAQLEKMGELTRGCARKGVPVKLVVDEWANTLDDILLFASQGAGHMIHIKMPDMGCLQRSVDAVLACRERGIETLLGGSANEAEISAKASVHLALAAQPTAILAKPGVGVDEALALTRNEMSRALAHRAPQ